MDASGNSAIAVALGNQVGNTATAINLALGSTIFKSQTNAVQNSAVFAFHPSSQSVAVCFRQAKDYLEVHVESPKRPLCRECELAAQRVKKALKNSKHKPRNLIAKLTEDNGNEIGVQGTELTLWTRLRNNVTGFGLISSFITAAATYFLTLKFNPKEITPTAIALASLAVLAAFVLVKTVVETCSRGDSFSWKFEK